MGADERFRRAKLARERAQFDGQLAQSLKTGDERAMPSDKFGLTIRPGSLVFHFSSEPTPPVATVTDVQQVLDPRAPAGMLRMRMFYDIFIPAGVPNPHLVVVGDVEMQSSSRPAPEVEMTRSSEEETPEPPSGPPLVLTDAQH